AKGTPEERKTMVTAPENIKNMLILNEEQAAIYSAKYEDDWNKMQLG
ncbi:MAG: ABC transporter substrate-binding protein, partial [Hyphomicrobiales bacterium]|nr:ABC transporter substrate-binding protein [Hyphomicrobiales bacterium]